MTGRRSKLLASTVVLAGLLGAMNAALAQDLTVVWADDSNSDVTYDPRVTQSRHEEQVIVQVFDQLVAADENGKLYPGLATVVDRGARQQVRDAEAPRGREVSRRHAVQRRGREVHLRHGRRPQDGIAGRGRHARTL